MASVNLVVISTPATATNAHGRMGMVGVVPGVLDVCGISVHGGSSGNVGTDGHLEVISV